MRLFSAAVFAHITALGEAFWWTKCSQLSKALSISPVITASFMFHSHPFCAHLPLRVPHAGTEMRPPAGGGRCLPSGPAGRCFPVHICSHPMVKAIISLALMLNWLFGSIYIPRSNLRGFTRHFLYLGNKVQHHANVNDPFELGDGRDR